MDAEYRGDLYYVDPAGDTWKITQRPGERNPKQHYWHAQRLHGEGHRVSASAYRLLLGVDSYVTGESEHDGATEENSGESASETDKEDGRYGLCQILTDAQADAYIENRRQAYLG